ncbi:hypothetical protein L7F22_011940 [Adiantum nelumboides]|nr:hypothetical protein [Adiantum nelumboides]
MESSDLWRDRMECTVGYPIERVWELAGNFMGMHKWATSFFTNTTLVEGEPQRAGCVRCLEGRPAAGQNMKDEEGGHHGQQQQRPRSVERLLAMDEQAHKFSFVVLESQAAPIYEGLVGTFQLLPKGPLSTTALWSYEIAPVPTVSALSFFHSLKFIFGLLIDDLIQALSSSSTSS